MDASSVTQEQVNIMVNEFGKIHIDSANETLRTFTKFNNRKKPWFDLDCTFERQYYRKMKRKHKLRNSNNSRKELKEAEKKYRKQMDISMRKYRQKMKKRIENFEIEKSKGILENIKQGSKEKTTKYFY